MTATKYMNAAIEHSKTREAESFAQEERLFPGHCSGWTETPAGKVSVSYVAAQGRNTWRVQHMRKTWALDGKRIAQDKLIAKLNECA